MIRRCRRLLGRLLIRLAGWDVDPDDPWLLVPDDETLLGQQIGAWVTTGLRMREYLTHWPECRAIDEHDLRCTCGLLDVLAEYDEIMTCSATGEDYAAHRARQ